MMSMVGLELTKFINPELTWKTVAKGSRSGSRRSRKPVGRSLKPGDELDGKSSKIVDDASVSESEKHGVAVLGRRFGDKVEDVPIKKRRLMFPSPSPPRAPSLRSEESEKPVATQCTSGRRLQNLIAQQQHIASDSTFAKFGHNRKAQKDTDQKSDYSEDFSGIEILAAAACINSMGDNFDNAEEVQVVEDMSAQDGIDSSTSTSAVPLKEVIEFLDTSKDLAHGENMEGVNPYSTSVAFLHDYPPNKDEGIVKISVASRDDRSHWDLNTIMDAWEPTCDDQIVNSQENVLEDNTCDVMRGQKLQNLEGCEMQRDLGETQLGTESMTQPTLGREEHKFEACPSSGETCFQGTFVPSITENALKESISTAADANASLQGVSMDTCSWISEGTRNAESGNGTIKHGNGMDVSGIQLGLAISSKSVQVEKNIVALPLALIAEKTAGEAHSLFEEAVSYSTVDCVNLSASNAYGGDGQHTKSVDTNGQDDRASVDDVTTVDLPVRVEPKELMSKSHGIPAVLETQCGFTSHEAKKTYGDDSASRSGKIDLECPVDDSYDSDVSQDNHGHVVGMENETKHQEGYDSQYEDGELRESDVYCWQGNETEDVEAEHVDYESDNGGTYDYDAADNSISVSGKVEVGAECGKQKFFGLDHFDCEGDKSNMGKAVRDTCQHSLGGSMATDVTEVELSKRGAMKASTNTQLRTHFPERIGSEKIEMNVMFENGLSGEYDEVVQKTTHSTGGKDLKESSQCVSSKMKLSGWAQFPDGCGVSSSDMTAEIDDGKFVVPRANRRELLSCVDLPSSSDGLDRKDTRLLQRSRSTNLDDSYPHFERVTGSDKLMRRGRSPLHMHDRSQGGGRWVDHSADDWDSKRHLTYRYYGPYDSEHPGPKSVTLNSKGTYRRVIRRSPADRDAAYGINTGMAAMRDIGTNSRGRSGRYTQGFGRGTRSPRNGYNEPMLEDTESSVRGPYYLARRERTFIPNHSRGGPHFSQPRKKSRSRSRSHSPPMWLLEKERNASLRHFSRSPDYRSEARMDRARFSIQKPTFAADYEAGYMSPPRNRFSPQQNSRWMDDRDCPEHFRDRRSPVRMFRQSQRFDQVGVSGRLKSDGYFRHTIRRGRFSENAANRGRRYEGDNDYRRKYGDRFESHPGRNYDRDGFVRRIRYDGENGFVAHSSHEKDDCVRGTDRRQRDIARKVREDKGQLRNNHDRMFESGPKTFEMQEFDEDAQLRNNHERMYDSGPKTFGMQQYDEDASPGRGRPS